MRYLLPAPAGVLAFALLMNLAPSAASAQEQCADGSDAAECAETVTESDAAGAWTLRVETSPFTAVNTILLSVESDQTVPNMFSEDSPVVMAVRCESNTTSVFFDFGDNFMSDVPGYGTVNYRVDERFPSSEDMEASEDHSELGLFNGAAAIPFVRSLFGGSQMLVEARSFEDEVFELSFDIQGLSEAITPLRTACNW